jgi:hypothetical protein
MVNETPESSRRSGLGACFVILWGVLPWLRRNDDPDRPDDN